MTEIINILNTWKIPFINISLLNFIYFSITFLIAIGFHEFAHAFTSVKLGDPTPKIQGRYTLNPFAHIDPLGFIMIFLIHFGWGKPVQVNPAYYKNPVRDELIVSLAGPFSNILLASIGIATFIILHTIGISNIMINIFFQIFIFINIALAIFNLLPLPPLDGYRIVKFLNPKLGYRIDQNLMILSIIFIIIVLNPITGNIIGNIIMTTTQIVYQILYFIISAIIGIFILIFKLII